MVGVVGLAGHALPAIALARALRDRGHEVLVHSFERWRGTVEGLDMRFAGAERQIVALADGADAAPAEIVRSLLPSLREFAPQVVVGDGLTLTPALAAEVARVPRATLLPEVYPGSAPGHPFFSLGLLPPRTPVGAMAWRATEPLLATRLPSTGWLRRSGRALNEQRAELGLPPQRGFGSPAGEQLTLVATLPQLEYPRRWPARRARDRADVPRSESSRGAAARRRGPAGCRRARARSRTPRASLVRVALEALASERVRVVVTMGGGGRPPGPVPANAVIADWIDYSQVMSEAALVICHGNHGTVVKALAQGVPLAVSPAMPDDAEHGARVAWSGAGLMVPKRLLSAGSLRAVARRLLTDGRFAERAGAIAAWSDRHDGAAAGAELVERHALRSASL